MALQFASGAIQWLAADVATTVYTVSGLAFAPKAIRFYWMGLGGAVDAASATVHSRRGVGFAVSANFRRSVSTLDQDAAATQVCECYQSTAAIASTTSGAGAVDGLLDINSFTADGFTVIVDDQVPVDLAIFWEAWGGDGIQGATILDILEPASTGTVSYVTGFQPAVVMFAGIQATTADTVLADSSGLSVGFATSGRAAENVVAFGQSDDGSATSDTDRYCQTGECVSMMILANAATMNCRAQLTQMNPNGFTLNWIARATTGRLTIALALAGGQFQAGAYTIAGNSGSATATVRGLPFTPIGLSFLGVSVAQPAAGDSATEDKLALGTAVATTSRRAQGGWSENALATASEINLVLEYDSCLAFPDNAGALGASYDLDALFPDGFQVIVDTAGGVAAEWQGYLACGGKAPVTFNNYQFLQVGDGMSVSEKIR
jgi:hypothetical protein